MATLSLHLLLTHPYSSTLMGALLGGPSSCSELFAAQLQHPLNSTAALPSIAHLGSASGALCLLLTFPQRQGEPVCPPLSQLAVPLSADDFELRLELGSTESRLLPASFVSPLPAPAPSSTTLHGVSLPLSFVAAFTAHSPLSPLPAPSATLYTYASAWDWAVEPGTACSPSSARPAAVSRASITLPATTASHPQPPVAGQLEELPRCVKASGPGRWLPASALPHPSSSLGPSQEGWHWVSDNASCALQPFTGRQVEACFRALFPPDARVLFLGDSNIRRDFKTLRGLSLPLAAEGTDSAWCAGRRGDEVCTCSDSEEHGEWDGVSRASFPLGGATVATLFIPGVLPVKPEELPTWRGMLFDSWPNDAAHPLGALVFDLVHWESSFGAHAVYAAELEAFASALGHVSDVQVAAGHAPPRLIYRRPNYAQTLAPSGEAAPEGRFESHGRVALFTATADEVLGRLLGDRLLVWDVTALQHSKPWEAVKAHHDQCWALGKAQHPASEDHQISMHLLLHELCAGA